MLPLLSRFFLSLFSTLLSALPGRASAHKEDGNEHFKGRRYKQAVLAYTAGIKEKCEDTTLTAVLYTNRAAAQFYLGEYSLHPYVHLSPHPHSYLVVFL